jgi:hypothetical protein
MVRDNLSRTNYYFLIMFVLTLLRYFLETTKHPIGYPFLKYYPSAEEVFGFEGGMIYKSVNENEYVIIVDNGTLADFLDEDDQDLLDQLVTVIQFDSEEELNNFLGEQNARFKKPIR